MYETIRPLHMGEEIFTQTPVLNAVETTPPTPTNCFEIMDKSYDHDQFYKSPSNNLDQQHWSKNTEDPVFQEQPYHECLDHGSMFVPTDNLLDIERILPNQELNMVLQLDQMQHQYLTEFDSFLSPTPILDLETPLFP